MDPSRAFEATVARVVGRHISFNRLPSLSKECLCNRKCSKLFVMVSIHISKKIIKYHSYLLFKNTN